MAYRSEDLLQGAEKPFYRSIFKSMGYSDFELDHRPMIGIANTFNTLCPGHRNLDEVCRRHNGLWNGEAEKYLLAHAKAI